MSDPTRDQLGRIHYLLLILILSIASFIQFTVVARTIVGVPLRADAGNYFSYAYNMTNHGVYSRLPPLDEGERDLAPPADALRSPGYPVFLALVGNPSPTRAYVLRVGMAQAALAVVSVLLIFLIGLELLRPGWALGVALWTALSPHLAVSSTYLLTETLFFFMLLASIYSLLKALRGRTRWLYALTGVVWGLCSLVRPTAMLLPLLFLTVVLIAPKLRKFRLGAALGFTCFVAVLTPWIVRNNLGHVEDSGPGLMVLTIAHGSYPDFMYAGRPASFGMPYRHDPDIERISRDLRSVLTHVASRFRADPATYARWYLFGKPRFFLSWRNVDGYGVFLYAVLHSPFLEDARFMLLERATAFIHWPLMVLGLAGAVLVVLRPRALGLNEQSGRAAGVIAALALYAIAFHMIAAPFPRYGIPFRPLFVMMAAVLLQGAWHAWAGRQRQVTSNVSM